MADGLAVALEILALVAHAHIAAWWRLPIAVIGLLADPLRPTTRP